MHSVPKISNKYMDNAQHCEGKATLSPRNPNLKMIYDNTRWSWRDLQLVLGQCFRRVRQNCEKLLSHSCLPVHMERLGSHWTDFYKDCICRFFENLSGKFKFH